MQGRDRYQRVRPERAMLRLRYAMGDTDEDPIEQLAAAMAELRVATARRRLLPRDSEAYEDAVAEETRLNDRILELAAKRNQTPISKLGASVGPRSSARIEAELIACAKQYAKASDGPARETLKDWIEALRDELLRARGIEDRDPSGLP
jgi:hypothetical protein